MERQAAGRDERLIITIDGPAGTGKSSVARDLAHRLGLEFLDTGAMYRAATAIALDQGLPVDRGAVVAELVRSADLRFDWETDPPTLTAFGHPIMHRLRDADVAANLSTLSEQAQVRHVLVERQRRIGEAHCRLVSEGRDQGSVVFYDANVKFYLDADPAIRARRRAEQLAAQGLQVDLDAIEQEIRQRDERDSRREVGPLVCPEDAIRIDTSDLSREEVASLLEEIVRREVGELLVSVRSARLKDQCIR